MHWYGVALLIWNNTADVLLQQMKNSQRLFIIFWYVGKVMLSVKRLGHIRPQTRDEYIDGLYKKETKCKTNQDTTGSKIAWEII